MRWQVYIIRCTDGTLYTGISTDVVRRLAEHARGKGAKYLRARPPEAIVYLESGHTRSSASRREAEIKRLPRPRKDALIESAQAETAEPKDG